MSGSDCEARRTAELRLAASDGGARCSPVSGFALVVANTEVHFGLCGGRHDSIKETDITSEIPACAAHRDHRFHGIVITQDDIVITAR